MTPTCMQATAAACRKDSILSCENLCMNFGGLAALNQLTIDICKGEILGLVGPNGSGKTTFFNVVSGIYTATGGSLIFNGHSIAGLSPQEIYHLGISRTFQRSRLCLELSVFDNLMIGMHNRLNHGLIFNLLNRRHFLQQYHEAVNKARDLLAVFNPVLADRMFDAAASFTMIDRRRIEICRALIGEPALLLLDEPSAGMTHEETRRLMDDILEIKTCSRDLTIVIIEHEMNVIRRITNRCVVLNFGEKLFEGSYEEMASDREVQKAYLGEKEKAA